MRPVSQNRRAAAPRSQPVRNSGRASARGTTRGAAGKARQAKASNGILALVWRGFLALIRRPMLLLTAVILLATVAFAVVSGGVVGRTLKKTDAAADAMVTHAGFALSQLHLSGNVRTHANDVVAALDVHAGQSIFSVDPRAARARLMQLPWVAKAEVKRRYPDNIFIQIVERVPYARWQTDEGLFLVDQSGHVITSCDADGFIKLPLLVGEGAPVHAEDVVRAVSHYRGIVRRVAAYQYQSGRRWNLLLDDGVVVKLPETGWQGQLGDLEALIVDRGILEKDIREIDLRHPEYYFFGDGTPAVAAPKKKTDNGRAI